jgi:hypothetical protein
LKAEVLNPDNAQAGYKKIWEVWNTVTNERVNYGPVGSITENGTDWRITGRGRSSRLGDFIKSIKTFYKSIDSMIHDLRYENIAVQPRTSTMIHSTVSGNLDEDSVFNTPTRDESFYGLSKNTKDFAIDDYTGWIKPGKTEPSRTYYVAEDYWTGTGIRDSLIVDLGGIYDISKIRVLFPWWGGAQRVTNRAYDFHIAVADDVTGTLRTVQDKTIGSFLNIAQSGETPMRAEKSTNKIVTGPNGPIEVLIGSIASGSASDFNTFFTRQHQAGPIAMRYIRVSISDVHAWAGTPFDSEASVDAWAHQCDPDYPTGLIPEKGNSPGIMVGKTINDRTLESANDCNASIVEVSALQEILPSDSIKPLALQRIDNNNLQIQYLHAPDASETVDTEQGFRKYEPGGLFRRFRVTWSGASNPTTKFFDKDCATCYPDSFNFGVLDHNNNAIYLTDSTGLTNRFVKAGVYTKHIIMKGAPNAVVTESDTWPAALDELSWGASYSYSEIVGDTAIVHFRGESFKWYGTIPLGKTPGVVDIDIRNKNSAGAWTSWTALENNFQLPGGIHAESVYEITYESGTLLPETVYEIRITVVSGFVGIDSFEGYWSSSFTMYNEDSPRINMSRPEAFKQIYDKRFSGGSMYKTNSAGVRAGFGFEGDRCIVLSGRGRNHGQMTFLLYKTDIYSAYDPGVSNHVFIPGGDLVDGSLTVDLDTGKRGMESPQYIVFDTNELFTGGLPWGYYNLNIIYKEVETYSTTVGENNSDHFISRCANCKTPTGDPVTINKYIYLDAIGAHERVGLSTQFDNKTHLEILTSIAEAVQIEWMVTEEGLRVEPRVGRDTEEVLREGDGYTRLSDWTIVNDVEQMASILVSSGSDIDGLPLFTITEDKRTRADLGRTVMRQQDFRSTSDYFQLIGLSRMELRKRRTPQKRITVTHTASRLDLNEGDSFILYTKKQGPLRVRITRKAITDSQAGTSYELECIKWPQTT